MSGILLPFSKIQPEFSGGASCRIWRVACDTRERARRQPVFLSPMRSRDDSLDDYHSSVADEPEKYPLYSAAES